MTLSIPVNLAMTNTTILPDFQTLASVEEGCDLLGRYLGLDRPVSRQVFAAVIDNPTYATALFTSRRAPAFRDHLLDHPEVCQRTAQKRSGETAPDETRQDLSSAALLIKAAKSFVAWGRSGFKTADDALYTARLAACDACPHHTKPERKVAYQIAAALTGGTANRKICGLCGCVTQNKARLADERCPGQNPNRPGFSRWGDPLSQASV
ncbi:hypothetical protein WL21_02785 [Burkholderia ubonensis]|nr:hypothetical protein WJ81_28815 [Burkholderia ubonensis]KVZ64063.1 hypothetical protein WL21_02785 [Burkholderia ubonensis]KVZ71017.1 hypothetical protein WL20_32750 [Burkholderia ubonensis]KWO87410.1 hypothetical protein WM32_10715 [Burkholderia ubonensis]OJB22114.1 hypothetical protein BGV54_16120 [Burkholderia ubonensis]